MQYKEQHNNVNLLIKLDYKFNIMILSLHISQNVLLLVVLCAGIIMFLLTRNFRTSLRSRKILAVSISNIVLLMMKLVTVLAITKKCI
jgi:hypothetical protein